MYNKDSDSYRCNFCSRWIQNTGDYSCEDCKKDVCSSCGIEDYKDGFLCPDCFSKPSEDRKKSK